MPPTDASEPDAPRGATEPTRPAPRRTAARPGKPAEPGARRGPGRRAWRVGRLRPAAYRAVRTAHIVVSGGWLGVGIGKLVLEILALTTGSAERASALFAAATEIGCAFPPMIVATLLTGVALAVGTRWGLLRYYWVITKLGLSLAVVVTAMALVDGWADQVWPFDRDRAGPLPGCAAGPLGLLTSLGGVYMAMLLVATVVSVYKPWGRVDWRRPSL